MQGGNESIPFSAQAEQSLLGALLAENSGYDSISGFLKAEHFYIPAHRKIYAAIGKFLNEGKPANPVTLHKFFEGDADLDDAGGADYLADLVSSSIGYNPHQYAVSVYDLWQKRRAIEIGESLIAKSRQNEVGWDEKAFSPIYPEDGAVIAGQAITELEELTSTPAGKEKTDLSTDFSNMLESLERRLKGEVDYLETGIKTLDRKMCGGLHPGALYVIAGRPGMGKSVAGLTIGVNIAWKKTPVLIMSLEMPTGEILQRLSARVSGIPMNVIWGMNKDTELDTVVKIQEAGNHITSLPLCIFDKAGLTFEALRSVIVSEYKKRGIGLVVIDYLGLIQSSNPRINKSEQIEQITSGLKTLAKQLNIPIILLSQLNRQSEARDDKRPQLSDLRSSGAIEQDADVVMLLHRDEMYLENPPDESAFKSNKEYSDSLTAWERKSSSCRGKITFTIAKNRQGETGALDLAFDAQRQVIKDMAAPVEVDRGGYDL